MVPNPCDRLCRLKHLLVTGAGPPGERVGEIPDRETIEQRVDEVLTLAEGEGKSVGSLRQDIRAVLDSVYESSPPDPVAFLSFAPEAIVISDGSRPVFPIEGDRIQRGYGTGPFVDVMIENEDKISRASLSVGRIESDLAAPRSWSDKWYAGTAFLVGDRVAMTNRHVMQGMVRGSGRSRLHVLNGEYWLNFDAQYGSTGRRRFKVERVVYARPDWVPPQRDFSRLDLALLELGEPEASGLSLPDPLPVSLARPLLCQRVGVIGYAGRPEPGPEPEILRLFGDRFGYKNCSSGEIDAQPGGLSDDERRWVVQHDASTLVGNSGSPVIDLTSDDMVLALHFAGEPRVGNFAHVFDQLGEDLQNQGVEVL